MFRGISNAHPDLRSLLGTARWSLLAIALLGLLCTGCPPRIISTDKQVTLIKSRHTRPKRIHKQFNKADKLKGAYRVAGEQVEVHVSWRPRCSRLRIDTVTERRIVVKEPWGGHLLNWLYAAGGLGICLPMAISYDQEAQEDEDTSRGAAIVASAVVCAGLQVPVLVNYIRAMDEDKTIGPLDRKPKKELLHCKARPHGEKEVVLESPRTPGCRMTSITDSKGVAFFALGAMPRRCLLGKGVISANGRGLTSISYAKTAPGKRARKEYELAKETLKAAEGTTGCGPVRSLLETSFSDILRGALIRCMGDLSKEEDRAMVARALAASTDNALRRELVGKLPSKWAGALALAAAKRSVADPRQLLDGTLHLLSLINQDQADPSYQMLLRELSPEIIPRVLRALSRAKRDLANLNKELGTIAKMETLSSADRRIAEKLASAALRDSMRREAMQATRRCVSRLPRGCKPDKAARMIMELRFPVDRVEIIGGIKAKHHKALAIATAEEGTKDDGRRLMAAMDLLAAFPDEAASPAWAALLTQVTVPMHLGQVLQAVDKRSGLDPAQMAPALKKVAANMSLDRAVRVVANRLFHSVNFRHKPSAGGAIALCAAGPDKISKEVIDYVTANHKWEKVAALEPWLNDPDMQVQGCTFSLMGIGLAEKRDGPIWVLTGAEARMISGIGDERKKEGKGLEAVAYYSLAHYLTRRVVERTAGIDQQIAANEQSQYGYGVDAQMASMLAHMNAVMKAMSNHRKGLIRWLAGSLSRLTAQVGALPANQKEAGAYYYATAIGKSGLKIIESFIKESGIKDKMRRK